MVHSILDPIVKEGLKSIYGVDVESLEFQETRKDFEGDVTLVVFPLLRQIKGNPAAIAESIGNYLVENADVSILVSRSNRLWTESDRAIVKNLSHLAAKKLHFILNGVELDEIEAVLGELPKKRSKLRRKIKDILRLQFYSKNQI